MKKVKLSIEDLEKNLEDLSKLLNNRSLSQIKGGLDSIPPYTNVPYCESLYNTGNNGGGRPSGLTDYFAE